MDRFKAIKNTLNPYSEKIISAFSSNAFLIATYVWFLLQTSYIALFTRYRIAPDAHAHLNLIKLYVRDGLDPFIQNQEGFYFLWEATRHPSTMYHYLLSFIYRASPFTEEGTILLLRFANIAIVLGALVVFYKLMKRLHLPKAARNISLFMLVNTMMFTFVAASINYDNLTVLVSMAVFYVFVLFIQKTTIKRLLILLFLLAFSGLVKYSFMPLAVPVFFIALFFAWKRRNELREDATKLIVSNKKQKLATGVLAFLLIATSFIFIERYAINVVQYGSVKPKCDQIHEVQQCRKSPLFRRSEEFANKTPTHEINITQYPLRWATRMKGTIFTVVSHRAFSQTDIADYGSYFIMGIMGAATITQIRKGSREINILLGMSIYFILVLLYVNYKSYLGHGRFGIALQGRYAFPVLPLLYAIGNYYTFELLRRTKTLQALYLSCGFIIFLFAALPSMLFSAGPDWYKDEWRALAVKAHHTMSKFNNIIPIFR